jgi:hypothetical protein
MPIKYISKLLPLGNLAGKYKELQGLLTHTIEILNVLHHGIYLLFNDTEGDCNIWQAPNTCVTTEGIIYNVTTNGVQLIVKAIFLPPREMKATSVHGKLHVLWTATDCDKNSALAFSYTQAHLLQRNGFVARKLSFEKKWTYFIYLINCHVFS